MWTYLRFVCVCLLITLSVAGLCWLAAWRFAGARLFSVQSGSMTPVFAKGDLLIDIRPGNLKAGGIVTYASQEHPGQIVTHRIVSISGDSIVTKGDNLATADPIIGRAMIKGRAVAALPLGGYVLDELRRPAGLIAAVYLPALIITVSELWRLTGYYGYRPYRFTKTA